MPAAGGATSGRAALARVRRTLSSAEGWPAGLTVLTGSDLFHLDATQRALLAALVPGEDAGFALTVFDTRDPVSVGEVVAAARSVGMFAPRRVVLVRDLAALVLEGEARIEAACEALAAYDADPPPRSHLLVRAPKLDVRRRLHKLLAAAPRTLVFGPGSPREIEDALRDLASARGLRLSADAVEALGDLCVDLRSGETDLHRAATELDKLATWLGPEAAGRSVDAGTLGQVASGAEGATGFQVADALAARDRAAALRLTRRLLEDGENPLLLLGAIAWRSRGLLQAKAMQAARVPEAAIRQATRLRDPGVLRRWRIEDLLRAPAALLAADRGLKSGREPATVLTTLIERLTEAG